VSSYAHPFRVFAMHLGLQADYVPGNRIEIWNSQSSPDSTYLLYLMPVLQPVLVGPAASLPADAQTFKSSCKASVHAYVYGPCIQFAFALCSVARAAFDNGNLVRRTR
jgi:hypothetical protein